MKVRVCGVLAGSLWLAGCAPEPEILPLPSVAMARASGQPLEKLEQGRAVYVSDCSRCHVPMTPKKLSGDDWHVLVPGMAWNAGISEAQEDSVLAYILAAKGVAGQ